nr:transcription factor EGL1 isoform X2 [Tanacetum cinerariifolium]
RTLAKNTTIWLSDAHFADSKVFIRSLLAKSASIQTVVCFPYLEGIVEFGVTEKVLEEQNIIQRIKSLISDAPPQKINEIHLKSCSAMLDHDLIHTNVDSMLKYDQHLTMMVMMKMKTNKKASLAGDLLSDDDSRYQCVLSKIFKNTKRSSMGPHYRNSDSKESAFVSWKNYDGMEWKGRSSQMLLKNVLYEVPKMHENHLGQYYDDNGNLDRMREVAVDDVNDINHRFSVLSSMVPSRGKVDKVSLLDDTINYLKTLERKVEVLQSSKNSHDVRERTSDNYANKRKASCDLEDLQEECSSDCITVSAIEKDVTIEIRCKWRENMMAQVFDAMSNLNLESHSVCSSTVNGILTLSIETKLKSCTASTAKMIRQALQRVIGREVMEAKTVKVLKVSTVHNTLDASTKVSAKHQLAVKGLSECKASEGNIRRIQVKDIVKEVEDYLKTYLSARMNISWRETQYLTMAGQKTSDPISRLYKFACKLDIIQVYLFKGVDTILLTGDPINTTNTTNVSQIVIDENLPQLLDSRGGSHVTNVSPFDKEDFTSWKVRFLVFLDGIAKIKAFMAILEDEPSVRKADARSGKWVDITMKKDKISDLKKVIEKWTCSKVTLDQLLSKQVPGNIIKALGREGRRKEKISSKEIVFTKANEFSSMPAPKITSDLEFECETQEPLPLLPKLLGAAPSGTSESLISLSDLTLNMAELTLDSSVLKITRPSPKVSPTYVIRNRQRNFLLCGSIAHEPSDCPKKHPNTKRPKVANRQMENLNKVRVNELRSDNETEFRNHKLEEFYNEKAITMLNNAKLLKQFWGEAVNTACYTQNRSIIIKRNRKTSYDVFRGRSPDISYFHVFGCRVHIHSHRDHLGKSNEKDDDGFFPGYSLVAKAFKVFNIRRQEMEEILHVTFSEDDEAISQSSTEADCTSVKCPMLPPNNLGPDESGVSVNETQYQANPKESHLVVVKRIFRYLKGTPNLSLWYPKGLGFDLKAYSNSDYVGCNLDRKSTLEAVRYLEEILWIKSQLADYNVLYDKVPIFCDNTSVIAISNNPVLHSRTKHIDIRCDEGIIAFNNVVALLEHPDELYQPMLSFISNSFINKALTLQPSAMYVEYLKEFWYTTEVKEETKTITFSLSWWDEPLSFTQKEFISAIGLPFCKNPVPPPPKDTLRAGLANLGLFDKEKPSLSSTVLVNSSPLKMKYFSPIWKIFMQYIVKCLNLVHKLSNGKKNRESNICYTRFLSLVFEKLLGDNYISNDLTLVKPYTIIAASFQKSLASEVPLTSHMLKVAKLLEEPKESLIPPSEEVNADDTTNKSLFRAFEQPVTQPKAPTDLKQKKKKIPSSFQPKSPYKIRSLEVSELAEEQGNQPSAAENEKLLNEVDEQNKAVQETLKSPYDTESEIKVVKSYFTCQILKLQDQIMHDSDELADCESMPKDDQRSVSRFKVADSNDTQRNDVCHSDHTFLDHNASLARLSIPDHLDHICEELLSPLLSKNSFPDFSQLHSKTAFHQSSKNLCKLTFQPPLNSLQRNKSDRFAKLETELSKTLKSDMGKLATTLVKSGMKEVRDELDSQAKSLGKFYLDVQSKGSKPCCHSREPQTAEPIVESQGEKPADLNIINKESAPPASDAKLYKGKELVVHNSEEKKSEGMEDDLDEDDKQPLSKRFKIMTPIPDISNPTSLNIFELRKLFNPGTLKAQAQKWTEHEAKKAKMMQEYKHQIFFRADTMPITKIIYVINSKKEATMEITRGDNPLNLVVHPNAKRLGLPPPHELATFGLTAEEKKRKRTEFLKEIFVKEQIEVDGPQRNLRESEFHITSTIQLIKLQKSIVQDSPEANEMYKIMELEIESRLSIEEPLSAGLIGEKDQSSTKHQLAVKGLFECKASESNIRRIQVKDIVKEVEDYLKTYSSSGMDIS